MNPNKSLAAYQEVLSNLKNQTAISFDVVRENGRLRINGIEFYPATLTALLGETFRGKGVLVRELPSNIEAMCKLRKISFLTQTGRLWLVHPKYRISVELARKEKTKQKSPPRLRVHSYRLPTPTTLISPNGLDILDALFRLENNELQSFKSALRFAQEFRLNQSKLSLMMTGLQAKYLSELKEKIRNLPDLWWETAFRYPMTRKGLTPFFETAKSYTSLRKDLTAENMKNLLRDWLDSSGDVLLPGPVEVAKALGLIRDSDIFLWGSPSVLQSLKMNFQLIPARNSVSQLTWHLASPQGGLERESIISPLVSKQRRFLFSELKANIFRAIWDFSFGGERLREIQVMALRKVCDGF